MCVVEKNYRLQDIQLSKNCSRLQRRKQQAIQLVDHAVHLSAARYGGRAVLRACQPQLPKGAKIGGEYRARTGDLLVANQALSQLS